MFPLGNKTRLDLPLLPPPIEKVPGNLSYLANVTSRQSGQSISFSAYTFSCFAVSRFPVAQVGFPEYMRRL